ncbi:hypothetical protein [Streptomyces sp. NPDC059850]|uniref:hypothetical protein n=1 Tax=Streptomyces sp. NPDC059850 TaxID=3346970 RepID=UPI0036623A62
MRWTALLGVPAIVLPLCVAAGPGRAMLKLPLIGALAVGLVPSLTHAVGRAGALLTDGSGYRHAVLGGRAASAPAFVPPHWSAARPHRGGRAARARTATAVRARRRLRRLDGRRDGAADRAGRPGDPLADQRLRRRAEIS